ncbi:MAG: hypothetical protein AB1599_05945 [Planctomycetota bacterium]
MTNESLKYKYLTISSLLICVYLCLTPFIAFSKTAGKGKPQPKPAPPTFTAPETTFHHVAGSIHLQTPVSGGKRNFTDYINLARQNDIGILVVTDHDTQKYQYGLWPLRGLISKTVDEPSVFRYGVENYFKLIQQANSSANDIILIDGVESTPFYYWSGSYFKDTLALNDRGKHILVVGMNDVNAYKDLPLIGNDKSRFNQYDGPQGYAPYQDLINYVSSKGGLTFWAHPEAKESKSINKIIVNTLAYPECVKATTNYTGFGVFWEGYQKIGLPNGTWDEVLREYADGRRARPCWAIGETDDYGDKDISRLLTVFMLKEKNYKAAIDALKTGKTYTVLKGKDSPPLMLDDFCVYNTAQPNIAYSGDELVTSSTFTSPTGGPTIRIKISFKNGMGLSEKTPKPKATLKVIRQGRVIKEVNQALPITLNFKDDYKPKQGERIYYRLEVIDERNGRLISNPVFVRFQ